MNAQILIVSFLRDADFLRYCLRSISKFATGFSAVQVVVPSHDADEFSWVRNWGANVNLFDQREGKGMLHHEYQKIAADLWCPGADIIVYMDSDCMFWEDAKPEDYVHEGKPILFRERYDQIVNRIRLNWKSAVKMATGIDPVYETMVRHPAVHLPETCRKTREVIEAHTGRTAEDYVLSCRNEFPQSFAEFPTLGAVALQFTPEKYHWVDHRIETEDGGYEYVAGRDRMIASWSHGRVERYQRELEAILAGERAGSFSAHKLLDASAKVASV